MRPFLLAALLVTSPALADEAPSVAVRTEMPARGTLPITVTAYGSAVPATDTPTTLSVAQEAEVRQVAVTPGEAVTAGEPVLVLAATPASRSLYQQAAHALDEARANRAHIARLLAQQLATNDQLATADRALADADAALTALKREGGDGTLTLTAPFDGIVATVPVAAGDRVPGRAPLLGLTPLDALVATVGIEPADRARIAAGEAAMLAPLSGGPAVAGQVLRVDRALNPRTRQIDVDISLPAATLAGESFRAAITVGQAQGWRVKTAAVQTDRDGAYVFQVNGGKAARVPVQVAATDGDTDIVAGGLDPARPVVDEGSYQLADGDAVRQDAAPQTP